MQKDIIQNWFFQQQPSEVWEYLTKPELIEQWLMKTNFCPMIGSKYDGTVNCEVLEVRPFTKLSYSWNGNTKEGRGTFSSIVVWTLIPKDTGTELQLQHNGFTILEDILNHASGWNSCIKRFEELINEIKT